MLLPTSLVGSYPQPEWLIDRERLSKQVPRVRMYDLWLVERVADICEISALPVPGDSFWELPYGVPSAAWS